MRPFLERLSQTADCFVHAYPNAGLPNAMGGYDDTPEQARPQASNRAHLRGCKTCNTPFMTCGTVVQQRSAARVALRNMPRTDVPHGTARAAPCRSTLGAQCGRMERIQRSRHRSVALARLRSAPQSVRACVRCAFGLVDGVPRRCRTSERVSCSAPSCACRWRGTCVSSLTPGCSTWHAPLPNNILIIIIIIIISRSHSFAAMTPTGLAASNIGRVTACEAHSLRRAAFHRMPSHPVRDRLVSSRLVSSHLLRCAMVGYAMVLPVRC